MSRRIVQCAGNRAGRRCSERLPRCSRSLLISTRATRTRGRAVESPELRKRSSVGSIWPMLLGEAEVHGLRRVMELQASRTAGPGSRVRVIRAAPRAGGPRGEMAPRGAGLAELERAYAGPPGPIGAIHDAGRHRRCHAARRTAGTPMAADRGLSTMVAKADAPRRGRTHRAVVSGSLRSYGRRSRSWTASRGAALDSYHLLPVRRRPARTKVGSPDEARA